MISAHTLVTVQLVWRQGLRALSDSAAAVVLAVTCLPFFVPVTRVRDFFLVPSLDSPASRAAATADGSVVLMWGACDRTPVGPSRSTVRGACPARATSCPAAPRGAVSGPPAFLYSSVHSHRGSPSGPVPACATAGLPGLFLPSSLSAPSCLRPGCSGSPTPRSPAAWSSGGSAQTVLSPRPRLPFHRSPVLTSQLPTPGADSSVPRRAVALSRAVPRLPPPLCRVCVPGEPPAMLAACHAHSDPRPRAPTVGPELPGTATSRPQTLTLSSARALGAPSRPSRGRALWPCPSGQSWGPFLALTPHPHHVTGACSRLRLSRAL